MVDFAMVTFKPEKAEVQHLSSLERIRWPSPQPTARVEGGGVASPLAAVVVGAGVVACLVTLIGAGAGVVVASGVVACTVSCTCCGHCGKFRVSFAQEMQHLSPSQEVPFSMATKPVLH